MSAYIQSTKFTWSASAPKAQALRCYHLRTLWPAGPDSQALIKDLGHDPDHTTLADICRHTQHLQTPSGYLTMLSMQSHAVGGTMVTTVLVQHTEPAAHMTAQTVSKLSQAPSQCPADVSAVIAWCIGCAVCLWLQLTPSAVSKQFLALLSGCLLVLSFVCNFLFLQHHIA